MTRRTVCALTVAALLAAAGASRAAEPPSSPEGILSFAEELADRGDTFRAVTEFLRFRHHFPDSPVLPRALKGLGRAYAQAGRWDDAARAFEELDRAAPSAENRLLLGAALYRGQQYPDAARRLFTPELGETGAILGSLALLRAGGQAPPAAEVRPDLATEFSALPRKSPALAGSLSAVLPGAGHLYADRPRDAAVSFALNGAFLWGTWEAAARREWALAGVLGLFELGWYAGNVVSSVNAAHKWNRREEGRFYERHESGVVPRWSVFALSSGAAVASTWHW